MPEIENKVKQLLHSDSNKENTTIIIATFKTFGI
jgi:hypothetical protein